MKKNKFIKNTIILIIGGFFTKILGMFLKIILTRKIDTETLGLYMLIMPTFNLFITLSQFGFPISTSKLVSENKIDNKKIVFSTIFMAIIITFSLMIFLLIAAPLIANILHNKDLTAPIKCIGFTLPFISISDIIRGYFFGKERMIPHILSNIFEQVLRILMYIIILPKIINYGIIFVISFIILTNILSETISILVLYIFLPKKININNIKIDFTIMRNILDISIPTTGSRIIGTIGYFFEPIILTTFLIINGFSNSYITYQYGIINGYVMPLLLLPSFFSMAISQATIPTISSHIDNKKYIKNKIKQVLLLSFLTGLIFTSFILLFPKLLMNFIYNTNEGINYIYILCPFFLLHYIQGPIIAIMQAVNRSKDTFTSTLIGMIGKIIIIIVLSYLNFGIYSLIFSIIFNIIFVTLFNLVKIKNIFN